MIHAKDILLQLLLHTLRERKRESERIVSSRSNQLALLVALSYRELSEIQRQTPHELSRHPNGQTRNSGA